VIYFARDTEFENGQQALASLGEIAELAKASGLRLRVVGHTDAAGDVVKNLQLALKRATFIADMLAARGVDSKNISPASRGSAEAAPGNAQALNRRVTFEIAESE
jgi:outer membrane protein OmpA-like peptidoglycan-associated protein